MDLIQLSQFLMYMTTINIIIYLISLLSFIYCRKTLLSCYKGTVQPSKKDLNHFEILVLHWIARYELLILFFNIIPLIAIKCLLG